MFKLKMIVLSLAIFFGGCAYTRTTGEGGSSRTTFGIVHETKSQPSMTSVAVGPAAALDHEAQKQKKFSGNLSDITRAKSEINSSGMWFSGPGEFQGNSTIGKSILDRNTK